MRSSRVVLAFLKFKILTFFYLYSKTSSYSEEILFWHQNVPLHNFTTSFLKMAISKTHKKDKNGSSSTPFYLKYYRNLYYSAVCSKFRLHILISEISFFNTSFKKNSSLFLARHMKSFQLRLLLLNRIIVRSSLNLIFEGQN